MNLSIALTQHRRIVLGISYNGRNYHGWQSQICGNTIQDKLESALAKFSGQVIRTLCAGRTDSGVHALRQVVHFDTRLKRSEQSWIHGVNRYLDPTIAVQWSAQTNESFHCRASAIARRYRYILLESTVRPSVDSGLVGWSYRSLNGAAMRSAADSLLGEHDFSSFRASQCQAKSPVKVINRIHIEKRGSYWFFEFEANAFLHHMIRNIMGCFVAIGQGSQPVSWLQDVLVARNRAVAAPTFPADGLYFLGPIYDDAWGLPSHTADTDALIWR
jgi:tRNA pseudouridine38-40 synthase